MNSVCPNGRESTDEPNSIAGPTIAAKSIVKGASCESYHFFELKFLFQGGLPGQIEGEAADVDAEYTGTWMPKEELVPSVRAAQPSVGMSTIQYKALTPRKFLRIAWVPRLSLSTRWRFGENDDANVIHICTRLVDKRWNAVMCGPLYTYIVGLSTVSPRHPC